jgi:Na+/proline symporter
MLVTDPNSKMYFVKQILAGAFITITMTGMDQEMMQKNISVKTLKDSQKNMMSLAVIMVGVILLFLFLGGLLYLYANSKGAQYVQVMENGKQVTKYLLLDKNVLGDSLFPQLAIHHMPPVISIVFVIGLISALFPSADGAITALTSSFCIDMLGLKRRTDWSEAYQKRIRQTVHLIFAAIFSLMVLVFKWVNSPSMIGIILKVAAYTYGPLLGLFTFGIITKRNVKDEWVPIICVLAPVVCFFIDKYQKQIFGSFEIGLELLVINGLLTFMGLLLVSTKRNQNVETLSLQ